VLAVRVARESMGGTVSNLCRTKPDSPSLYANVVAGAAGRDWGRAGTRETDKSSFVWRCSAATTLAGLSAHYAGRRLQSPTTRARTPSSCSRRSSREIGVRLRVFELSIICPDNVDVGGAGDSRAFHASLITRENKIDVILFPSARTSCMKHASDAIRRVYIVGISRENGFFENAIFFLPSSGVLALIPTVIFSMICDPCDFNVTRISVADFNSKHRAFNGSRVIAFFCH